MKMMSKMRELKTMSAEEPVAHHSDGVLPVIVTGARVATVEIHLELQRWPSAPIVTHLIEKEIKCRTAPSRWCC